MTMFHSRRLRRLLAAAPLAVGLTAGAVAITSPAPASASTGIWICIEINGGEERCVWVPHAIDWKYLLCPGCPDFSLEHEYVTNPEVEQMLAGEVAQGVADLLVADVVGDRAARATGLAHFDRAATLGRAGVPRQSTPWDALADQTSDPWIDAVEQDVADGLNLLQQSASTPDRAAASRLRSAAIGQLDAAVDTLVDQVTSG